MSHFKYIVIGKGLMGAAAAKHLSQREGAAIAVIGPEEPEDRATHEGVFGSHYDEGRITRILDPDPIWARLAAESLSRYHQIEQQSGIAFYNEVGHLSVGLAPQGDNFIARNERVCRELDAGCESLSHAEMAARFPYLSFEAGSAGVYQRQRAGHVSPRRQVQAQTEIIRQQEAVIIPEAVTHVHETSEAVEVTTDTGQTYRAERVLVAAGGFSNVTPLLPARLDLTVYPRMILLWELSPADAERLRAMPSLIHEPEDVDKHCYILPPIEYPNGKTYLKIGGGPHGIALTTLTAMQRWFQKESDPAAAANLAEILHSTLPDVTPVAAHTDTCVTSYTRHKRPYIGLLSDRLGVVTGGNGCSAKSADEIGRLGAAMISGVGWPTDLAPEIFAPQTVR